MQPSMSPRPREASEMLPITQVISDSIPPQAPMSPRKDSTVFPITYVVSDLIPPQGPMSPYKYSELLPVTHDVSDSVQRKSRTLCLCFDGTGNKFGENSNIVRFFRALKKNDAGVQIPYYQAGIGTYNNRQFHTRTVTTIASVLDQAIALHLNDHVKDGYKFLMQNYQPGDKICLFGFSRGAYTARALAGMLYKVGLLPQDNDQQVDFAFTMYQSTDLSAAITSKEFKDTFCMDVEVEFLGVWDTVSSVGLIPRFLPYSSACHKVKTFRHALALDERRARFRPNIWGEPTVREEVLDHDIEIDLPSFEPGAQSSSNSVTPDEWVYEPADRSVDVKEVWFSGCHADVGGGSHRKDVDESLSNITLRWMIEECREKLAFDLVYLKEIGIDLDVPQPIDSRRSSDAGGQAIHSLIPTFTGFKRPNPRDPIDAVAWIYDQLERVWFWRPLEWIPMLSTNQKSNGTWVRRRMPNYGAGRTIPHRDYKVLVHSSVEKRMKETSYKPKAQNWDEIVSLGLIEYVD